jgi:FkbM family methyltransferase
MNAIETAVIPISVVVPTAYGAMIVHRLDDAQGLNLFRGGRATGHAEIMLLAEALSNAPTDGRVIIDVGANFGTFSLALSRIVGVGGKVIAFEPQRIIFYMAAGTMALNSALNVHCINAAVGAAPGQIEVPQFDYFSPLSFGSVEFGPSQREVLAQSRGHNPAQAEFVSVITIDSLGLDRLDLLKIDAEGMEMEVLDGAEQTIGRCRPIIYVEWLKVGEVLLRERLNGLGYSVRNHAATANFLAVPRD